MKLHTDWVRYDEGDKYVGYVASPAQAKASTPAVMVLQEIWGVDDHIQNVVDRFATAGYVAMAPDLFAENGSRPDMLSAERINEVKRFLDQLPPTAWGNPAEREAALARLDPSHASRVTESQGAIFGRTNAEAHLPQLLATAAFLRETYERSRGQGVASVGFCLGGALSAYLACHDPKLKGAIIFYGGAPSPDKLKGIECDVLGFYGELDKRLTDALPTVIEAMKEAGVCFEYHIYDGAHHAFFNDTRGSYNVAASRDAFARALAFFRERL